MNVVPDAARLTDRVAALVEAAKKAGADAADAVAVRGRSTSVSVRLGKVESTNASEGDDVSLRVFGEHLFTTGIYRAVGKDGEAKPASLSFLHRWLGEAREAGML